MSIDSIKQKLDELVPMFGLNKAECDSYTKLCKEENNQIKELLDELGESDYTSGGFVVHKSVAISESVNMDKLVRVITENDDLSKVDGLIIQQPTVNMDVLESYLYNNPITPELAEKIKACTIEKETVRLTIKAAKGE